MKNRVAVGRSRREEAVMSRREDDSEDKGVGDRGIDRGAQTQEESDLDDLKTGRGNDSREIPKSF